MLDNPIARVVIQQLLNGNAFYLAMILLTFAAVSTWIVHEPGRWTKIGRRAECTLGIVLLGMTLSFLSFGWVFYLAMLCVVCVFRRRMPFSKARYIGLAAIVGLAVYEGEFFRSSAPTDQPRPIVVYGDSLSAAFLVEPDETWSAIVGRETGRPVDNRAVAGSRTADALARQLNDPVSDATAVVLIGGNDQLDGTPVDEYERELETLVIDLVARGNRVIVVEPPVSPTSPRYGWIQPTASSENVTWVRRRVVANVLFGDPAWSSDGLHLSRAGHEVMAKRILEYLTPP